MMLLGALVDQLMRVSAFTSLACTARPIDLRGVGEVGRNNEHGVKSLMRFIPQPRRFSIARVMHKDHDYTNSFCRDIILLVRCR
jgi:hypothetical protein